MGPQKRDIFEARAMERSLSAWKKGFFGLSWGLRRRPQYVSIVTFSHQSGGCSEIPHLYLKVKSRRPARRELGMALL